MWAFNGHGDRMRLQEEDLTPEASRKVLLVLTGDPNPGNIRQGGALLYLCSGRRDFVNQMNGDRAPSAPGASRESGDGGRPFSWSRRLFLKWWSREA